MKTMLCVPGRFYPGDKVIVAKVVTAEGATFFFNLSDTVSENRLFITIRSLVAEQKGRKTRYEQPKEKNYYWGKPSA